MTSGVSGSSSSPCSATSGEAKTSAIKRMQTLRPSCSILGVLPVERADGGFNTRIQAEESERASEHTRAMFWGEHCAKVRL